MLETGIQVKLKTDGDFSTPPTPNKDLLKRNAPAFQTLPASFGGTGPIRGRIPNGPTHETPTILG